ncbi:UDP-glucuronosyltransferase [Paenibacillus albidus]|nr:UDP-glucuronosyltransferase [Paenibacillus albidus]
MTGKVMILCSGFGLGFYIPGLLIARKLQSMGIDTCVEVFESLMNKDMQLQTDKSRHAYRDNFAVALASQKIPGDIRGSLDLELAEDMIQRWLQEGISRFIVLSGHWVHILDMLRKRSNREIEADLLYVDSSLSPSWKQLWKLNPHYAAPYREIGLYSDQQLDIQYRLDVDDKQPVPFAKRPNRLVIHGGGWGIGTFREKLGEMESANTGYEIDIVAYSSEEISEPRSSGIRYAINDPEWRAWHRNKRGVHTFPPFDIVSSGNEPNYQAPVDHHGLYSLIRNAAAVVSKPGAGALMDSLASGTPLVMLEPFGEHEKRNASIWKTHGLGIDYSEWEQRGYSMDVLKQLSDNLISKRAQIQDYTTEYADRLVQFGRGR